MRALAEALGVGKILSSNSIEKKCAYFSKASFCEFTWNFRIKAVFFERAIHAVPSRESKLNGIYSKTNNESNVIAYCQ